MRILMWVSFYWPQIGGVETITRQLAHALKKRGHTVCIFAAHGNITLPDVSDDDGIVVHRFPFWEAIGQRDPLLIYATQKRLDAVKKEFAPDLIHLNCFDPSLFFQRRSAGVMPAPTVITLHWTPPSELWEINELLRQTLLEASWIVAISQHQLGIVNTIMPSMSDRLSIIVNGLNEPPIASVPVAEDNQRILCIGRLVRDKGFDLSLDAFAQIVGEFPNARLIIAGDGIEKRSLQQLAQTLGIASQVDFTGWVSHEDVPEAMNQSSMVLMPSRFEPFGLVAVEAGQMSRPIIATAVGGLVDIVVDGETGLLVPDEDVAGLAGAIARLLRDPPLCARLGQAGSVRAREKFAAERNTADYESLFKRLTENTNVVA